MTASAELSPLQPELRHQGVQVLVHRTRASGRSRRQSPDLNQEIFTQWDSTKAEIAAGIPHPFIVANERRLHIPAGGRQAVVSESRNETVAEAARREWLEEWQEVMGQISAIATLGLSNLNFKGGEHQQFYPIIVGQVRPGVAIHEIAVTTLYVEFDTLPWELQSELKKVISRQRAKWIKLHSLTNAFEAAQTRSVAKVDSTLVRPHLLTTAMIYHWQQLPDWEPDLYTDTVEKWNRRAYRYLERASDRTGLELTNGTMTTHGKVRTHLPASDHEFLNTSHLIRNKRKA